MLPFTSLFTKTIAVSGDPDQTVTIRKLAPEHLERAMKTQQRRVVQDLREMGGLSVLKEFQDLKQSPETAPEVVADPLLQFDRVTLLETGITAWTYEQQISRATCADLDEETAEYLAREILRYAKPSLFLAADEAHAEKKDAAGRSIVH